LRGNSSQARDRPGGAIAGAARGLREVEGLWGLANQFPDEVLVELPASGPDSGPDQNVIFSSFRPATWARAVVATGQPPTGGRAQRTRPARGSVVRQLRDNLGFDRRARHTPSDGQQAEPRREAGRKKPPKKGRGAEMTRLREARGD